ncbi:MAG: adenylate/guanylate cyclase domain-containing protein [Myxococcaceae bacterium]|nr:MAG: adenylate/guanylate cyclase domain-containing protein [Myxococcaceae bacterium]
MERCAWRPCGCATPRCPEPKAPGCPPSSTSIRSSRRWRPTCRRGAILLLDIAGFTPIVVGLSGAGPRGIDALQRLLTNYYTEMIDVVRDHGGDIYQFAGDSILACFEAAPGEADGDVVQRAAVCALGVQRRLARFARLELLGQRFGVSSRIGIGFGESNRIVMGASGLWMHPALVGEPLAQAVRAEKQATVSEVVLSPRAWSSLPEGARKGEAREGGNHRLALDAPVESVKRPLPAASGGSELVGRCALLLHPVLFTKITTAHQEFSGDFRDVTCFFVRFTHAPADGDASSFTRDLNAYYEFVQRESAHHGGVLLMDLQIGVATGHAYCGDMGSPWRKGYSALGEVVNMAARLMTHGRGGSVHICANTQGRLQQGGFATEFVEDAKLKGVSRTVPVYRLLGETRRSLFIKGRGDIIGRRRELAVLHEALDASLKGRGKVCVVSGEAGIGKSRLGARVLEDAEENGAGALYGICYSYEMFTPFFPWKEVLLQAFGLHDSDDFATQMVRLSEGLDGLVDVGPEWIPVVAGILGIALEETPDTASMDARRKQQKVFQIVHQLLEKLSLAQPLLLFFEDLHWADNISLDLLQYLAVRLGSHRIMVLATMRPGDQLRGLRELPEFCPVELSSLDDDDTREMLRAHLRLSPPDLELKRGLQDLLLPDSIQDVVLSRIDLLSETEKLVVKVASVIGRVFTLDAVSALVPGSLVGSKLREAVDTLTRLGLILLETEEPYTCLFKHIVIRDVAPEAMLLKTRRVMQELAETLLQAGNYAAAIIMFEQCLVDEEEVPQQAELHLGLGRAHQEKGESSRATHHLEQSLVLRGRSLPRNLPALGLRTLGNLLLRGLATLLPFILRPIPAARLPQYLQQLSHHGERALEYARRSKDPVAEGLALSRLGIQAFFANELKRSRDFQEQAVSTLRVVGERWERQTSLMMQATGEFLCSRFKTAEELYEQMKTIGVELNALMHQGWAHSWAPMCRYLLGEGDVGELCAEMELVDAAEAALFALEEGATVVPRKKLLRIVRLACIKARMISKLYPYLKGPALRVTARSLRLRKGPKAAEPVFLEAITLLEASPNRWETGVAYFDAAVALPHRRDAFLARAKEIFVEVGALAELRRIDRLQASAQALLPGATVRPPLRDVARRDLSVM